MSSQILSNAPVNEIQLVAHVNVTRKEGTWMTYTRKARPAFKAKTTDSGSGTLSSVLVERRKVKGVPRLSTRRICVPSRLVDHLQGSKITAALSSRVKKVNESGQLIEDLSYKMSQVIDYFYFDDSETFYEVTESYPDGWVLKRIVNDQQDKDVYLLGRGNILQNGKIHNGVCYFPSFVEIYMV